VGRKPSIDTATGERLIEAYQRLGSKRAAADEVGVSLGSALRFFESLPAAAAPAVAQRQELAERAVVNLWDTRQALDHNWKRVQALIEQLDSGITVQNGEYVTLTPPATLVAALREAREHIKTSLELGRLLVDIEEVRAFQQAVIEAIGEADEATRERVIAKLRQRRALGLAL
jgi:hypothetical protein